MTPDAPESYDGETTDGSAPERQAAFARFFEENFAPVYRYICHHVPVQAEATDLAHGVFYRLWTRGTALDFDDSSPFLPYALAKLAILDYRRRTREEADAPAADSRRWWHCLGRR